MSDRPIDLDSHRGVNAQKATDLRRLRIGVEKDQDALRQRRDELERFLTAAPAETWADAAEKARYLLGLFAETSIAGDQRHRRLIDSVLADFERLLGEPPQNNDR